MSMTYTEQGLAMVTDALESGQKLQFTRVEITADPQRSGRDLKHQLEIASVSRAGPKQIRLKAVTDNAGYTSDCYFNRIDIYVEYLGEEVLFCYQQSESCPFYLPAYDGRKVESEIDIYIIVSSDAVKIEHDGIYVLQTDYEEDMKGKVSIAQVIHDTDTDSQEHIPSSAVTADLQRQINGVIEALLDTAMVEEKFNQVYFGIDPEDPSGDGTAMGRQEVEEATREPWDGSTSEDETAMSSKEVEEAMRQNGRGSPQRMERQ